MEDPYIFVENLDKKTIEYVQEQKKRFSEHFGNVPESIKQDVSRFHGARKIIDSITSGEHIVNLYLEGRNYYVSVNGKKLYETGNIITQVFANRDCNRIALFETSGSDFGTLKIFENGNLKEEFNDKVSSLLFTDDSYYLVKTYSKEKPPDGGELNSHRVLRDGKIVFGEGMSSQDFISLHRSGDKVIVTVGNWMRSSVYAGSIDDPTTWSKVYDFDYPVKPLGFVDGKISYLEMKGNGRVKVGDKIVLEPDEPIEDCVLVDGGYLVLHMKDAKIIPAFYDSSGNRVSAYDSGIPMGLNSLHSDEHSAIVNLQSFGVPYSLYRFQNGKLTLLEENKLLNLEVSERWVDSTGAKIHYFMITPEGNPKNRALAYGYGGFNISMSPMFSPLFVTLLNNGVSIAVANLRGGGEYGEDWHLSGTRERKQNVFDDFISVISSLKDEGYKVVALGGSNGGLLVGSTMTQRPELLDGAVIGKPVLDMLRFHVMSVGKYWVTEYGNPDDPNDADFLSKYSPYENIRDTAYPRTLIHTRMNDDRVHPAHAIKFHMKLDKVNSEAYLRVNDGGGHIGVKPEELVGELSEDCNFILSCLNS